MFGRVCVALAVGLAPLTVIPVAAQHCPKEWADGFQAPGVAGGFRCTVYASAVYDDGPGPALFVAGDFGFAGSRRASGIARWDGANWSALAGGIDDQVYALAVFDDGTGPALYAAGDFWIVGLTGGVARWDGTTWGRVGERPTWMAWTIRALAVFDDGTGSALYAGGGPVGPGLPPKHYVAKWDGTNWLPVANGSGFYHYDFAPVVKALAVYDDGTGPALYAGGHFTKVDDVPAYDIAKWDGQTWSAVGGGIVGSFGNEVRTLAVYDDGRGPALYAGGYFVYAGYVEAHGLARWDGQSWSAVDGGVDDYDKVNALSVYDDGTGPALYVGGEFTTAGGAPASGIARWNGSAWAPLGTGVYGGRVHALTEFDDGQGPALYVAGEFSSAGGVGASRIARWDGQTWSALGSGNGMDDVVYELRALDTGDGPLLYAGGVFLAAGGTVVPAIATWNGAAWSTVGGDLAPGRVLASATYDDGGGPALYVGGDWLTAEGLSSIWKWDGAAWSTLGGGTDQGVGVLAVFDDGRGPGLYAGGIFDTAGGQSASRIARWDGTSWSALGSGVGGDQPSVNALTVFDDGGGPALYVGGKFSRAGGISANRLAKWDGVQWSALGSGLMEGPYVPCYALALTVFDDGSGPALYVGGRFWRAGGVTARNIARWDGQGFHPVGDGLGDPNDGDVVSCLTVFDDGTGPALYAGGRFHVGDGFGLAKWDGTNWQPVSVGTDGDVYALAGFDDGHGPALWVGGFFLTAGGKPSAYIAKWGCAANWLPGDLNCDGSIDSRDINPFVMALSNAGQYETAYPDCLLVNADINGDAAVNFHDIMPYVDLLHGGGGR